MFVNRFTAVIDACVLVSAAKRDLILSLAEAELFRPRWTDEILEETRRAVVKTLEGRAFSPEDAKERAGKIISVMTRAFEEAPVLDTQGLANELSCLPDKDDHHVLAAAIQCKASVIVTENLKDFPAEELEKYEIEAISADCFIADAIDLDYDRSIKAIRRLRERLKNPALNAAELLERWKAVGLTDTVDCLYPHLTQL